MSHHRSLVELMHVYEENSARRSTRHELECWLCCSRFTQPVLYNEKRLCTPCAADCLLRIVMPALDLCFYDIQDSMAAEVGRVFQEEQAGVANVPPPESFSNPAPTWKCFKCTLENTSDSTKCRVCRERRPQEPICPLCLKDFLVTRLCHFNRRQHKRWTCAECKNENLDSSVQCRCCRKPRVWFCAQCTLENVYTRDVCSVCGGSSRVASLGSFTSKQLQQETGISSNDTDMERNRSDIVVDHRDRLEFRISQTGLRPVNVGDDGNCLFRALSMQLLRSENFYAAVRHIVVRFMKENAAEYALYIGQEEFNDYIERIARNCAWGDEMTVQAASRALNVNVHVVTSEEERWHLQYKAPQKSNRRLFLAYIRPIHYYCMIPEKDVELPNIDLEHTLSASTAFQGKSGDRPEEKQNLGGKVVPLIVAADKKVILLENIVNTSLKKDLTIGSMVSRMESKRESTIQYVERSLTGTFLKSLKVTDADWLPWHDIRNLPHSVLVSVELGESRRYLNLDKKNVVSLSKSADLFYLHRIPIEVMVGPRWKLAATDLDINHVRQDKSCIENSFFVLQHTGCGGLLTCSASDFQRSRFGRGTTSKLLCTPELPLGDWTRFVFHVPSSCSPTTTTLLPLTFGKKDLMCRYIVHHEENLFCSEVEVVGCNVRFLLPKGAAPWRECKMCQELFLETNPVTISCRHQWRSIG